VSSSPPETVLGIAIRDISRLRKVATIVTRHGFGEFLARSPLGGRFGGGSGDDDGGATPAPVRFRDLLEELGPTWIKLGQILSTRRDLFPPDWIEALSRLQDEAPVVPWEIIESQVESGLGRPIEDIFASVEREPLGTASIAQTHRARTRAGDEVVLKVQRPDIEKVMRSDLDLLYLGARIVESTIEEAQLYAPSEIVAEFERGLLRELNFANELSNLETARQFLDPKIDLSVPRPYTEYSSNSVLCMEYFAGKPVRTLDTGSLHAKKAAAIIVEVAARQIFIDGFFHGDPHGGNILVGDEGSLCMIDLGLVGRLSIEQREQIVTLAMATLMNDTSTMASTLLAMGTATERVNLSELKSEISRIRREQLEVASLDEVDSSQFAQEFAAAAARFKIRLAPEYAIMVKAAATLEGVIRGLDPGVDIPAIVRPTVEQVVSERMSPDRMVHDALTRATGMGGLVSRLPDHLEQLMHDMETGNLQLRALTPELDSLPQLVRWSSGRASLTAFSASMSICCALIVAMSPASHLQWGLAAFTLLCALIGWGITFASYWIGTGQAVSVSPLIRLFRRK